MLEGQVEELEVMNDEYQDRESQWNMIKYVIILLFAEIFIENFFSIFFSLTRRQQYQAQEKLEQQLTEAINSLEEQRQLKYV